MPGKKTGKAPRTGDERLPYGSAEKISKATKPQQVAFEAAQKKVKAALKSQDEGAISDALLERAKAYEAIDQDYVAPSTFRRLEEGSKKVIEDGRLAAHNALDAIFDGITKGLSTAHNRAMFSEEQGEPAAFEGTKTHRTGAVQPTHAKASATSSKQANLHRYQEAMSLTALPKAAATSGPPTKRSKTTENSAVTASFDKALDMAKEKKKEADQLAKDLAAQHASCIQKHIKRKLAFCLKSAKDVGLDYKKQIASLKGTQAGTEEDKVKLMQEVAQLIEDNDKAITEARAAMEEA